MTKHASPSLREKIAHWLTHHSISGTAPHARELVVYVWSLELAKGLGVALRTRRAVPAAEPL